MLQSNRKNPEFGAQRAALTVLLSVSAYVTLHHPDLKASPQPESLPTPTDLTATPPEFQLSLPLLTNCLLPHQLPNPAGEDFNPTSSEDCGQPFSHFPYFWESGNQRGSLHLRDVNSNCLAWKSVQIIQKKC